MNAFVDTSAFLAVLNRDDDNHLKARSAWQSLLEENTILFAQATFCLKRLLLFSIDWA